MGHETEEKKQYYAEHQPIHNTRGSSKIKEQLRRGMGMAIIIVFGIIVYFAVLRLNDISAAIKQLVHILKPIIYGIGIAYLLNPVMMFVEKHVLKFLEKSVPNLKYKNQISRGVGISVAIALLLAIIIALCNMLIPQLISSIKDMIMTLPEQLNSAVDKFYALDSGSSVLGSTVKNVVKQGTDYFQNWLKTDFMQRMNVLMSNVTVGVISLLKELLNAVIGIIVSIYLLASKETFIKQSKKITYAIFRPNFANMILHVSSKSNEIFGGFIVGKVIDSAIIGVLCFIGLSFLNMPYTLLVSVVVGVTNIIPFFGPYIGAIPSTILIMLSDPKQGIYFLLFILILQQIDGNIIGPKILGDSTGLSAFWVVFAILVGGGLFGVIGMLLGVPTFAVLSYLADMWLKERLKKKQLPVETEYYDPLSYVGEDGKYRSGHENMIDNEKTQKSKGE